jgi:hypothetical protein
MCVPPSARHDRGETCTPRAASSTRPSPDTAGGGPALGRTCACRHRRVAVAARPARPVQLADATALPGHGRQRSSAGPHMGVPPSARRRCGETCTPRAARATRPPSPATAGGGPTPGRTWVCRHRRVAIPASRHAPCISRDALAPPSATAGGGPAPGRKCVRRHRRLAIAAGSVRPVQLARRDHPPRPRPAEGQRRAAHVCAAIGASRSLLFFFSGVF